MPFLFDLGSDDSWVGYDNQREEILSYISDNISGVIWLAGDFHMGAVTHVEGDDSPHYNQREIFMGPGGQFSNPGWFLLETSSQADQYDFTTPNYNFVRIIADPIADPYSAPRIVGFATMAQHSDWVAAIQFEAKAPRSPSCRPVTPNQHRFPRCHGESP